MEYDPQDNDVIHLLKKLKDSNGAYPPEMLALRREGYVRQVAEISGAAGLAIGLKNAAKHAGKTASLPPTTGTIVEALLVVSLVAEAGAVTYFYRDKLAETVRSITHSPKVVEVSHPPIQPSPSLIAEIEATLTPSPMMTETTTGTVTETGTSVVTPSPELADGPENGTKSVNQNQAGTTVDKQPQSTEAPNGNNGNHYGQTPKPARTKEAGTNNTSQDSSTSKTKQKP